MTDESRIDELRRRLRKDPASIAFAQLGEELRRAGRCQEAVETCRAGLARYPAYLSARVTLGRALLELNQLDAAQQEIDEVLKSAPGQLAASRALADIQRRREADTPERALTSFPTEQSVSPLATSDEAAHLRVARTLTALEAWLAAIHVTRAGRSA